MAFVSSKVVNRSHAAGLALCIAAAVGASALTPSQAEAKGCADRVLAAVYTQAPNRASIPKTRRVQRNRKLRTPAPVAAEKPKAAIAHTPIKAKERPYLPAVIEELDLESFSYDVLLSDPRRYAMVRLNVVRPLLAMLEREDDQSSPIEPDVFIRTTGLRLRLLPKIPEAGDSAAHV